MLFLLYGEDGYRSKQKLAQMIEFYKQKNRESLSLFIFDYEQGADFNSIEIATKQVSMFVEKKLIVISGLFSFGKDEDQAKIIKLLKTIKRNDIFFIFYDLKILSTNKLFKFLKQREKVQIQEFKLLKGGDIHNWVSKEFLSFGVRIERDALALFLEYTGNDLWKIQSEINKLANYCQDRQRVVIDDIKLLIHSKQDINIFQTIEAIANKDEARALKLIHNHIQKGDNELYILTMIAYQFKILLTIRDLIDKSKKYEEIGKELKMHPFVLRKNYKQAMLFKMAELKNIYNKILETDLKIKQGLNPQLGIELLLLT